MNDAVIVDVVRTASGRGRSDTIRYKPGASAGKRHDRSARPPRPAMQSPRSGREKSAVGVKVVTDYVGSSVGRQPHDGLCDFVRSAHPAQWQ